MGIAGLTLHRQTDRHTVLHGRRSAPCHHWRAGASGPSDHSACAFMLSPQRCASSQDGRPPILLLITTRARNAERTVHTRHGRPHRNRRTHSLLDPEELGSRWGLIIARQDDITVPVRYGKKPSVMMET